MGWLLYSDILCNVQIPRTRNGGTQTINDLTLEETKMIHRAIKAIFVDTQRLICVNQWFLKQDVPIIVISLPITSIELHNLRLAFEF